MKKVYGSIGKRLRGHLKIDKLTGCHLWTGFRDPKGYGLMTVNGVVRAAHRVAWERANGPIPQGMIVMHTCDNPPCCNPKHLKLGTQAENVRDRIEKGRGRGARALDLEKHPQWGERPKSVGALGMARPAANGSSPILPRPAHQGAAAFAAVLGLPLLVDLLDTSGLQAGPVGKLPDKPQAEFAGVAPDRDQEKGSSVTAPQTYEFRTVGSDLQEPLDPV
jgi:hypothetical protein